MSATIEAPTPPQNRIPTVRRGPTGPKVLDDLGLLAALAGTWMGTGFNLVARPDKQGGALLYLELNQTEEHFKVDPIVSSIPNRGFAQNDIELFGLTYLQKISDSVTGGALHIEPGIWITQPSTTEPPETTPPGKQIIARMSSIPHGNSILVEGLAERFTGLPTLKFGAFEYNGSIFPSFNSTPFPVGAAIFAAGTSEFNLPPPPPPAPPHGFTQYTIANADSAANPRTPFGNTPAVPLPAAIDGISIQDIVNDPIRLLQQVVTRQRDQGFKFEGIVLNIATQAKVEFGTTTNAPTPTKSVDVPAGDGGIENIPFLRKNADTALVYATFWIETVTHPDVKEEFQQLQYAQMVLLNFPILGSSPSVNLSWPHVSVGTLQKIFG